MGFLMALELGCAGKQRKLERPPVPRGPEVVDIRFEGNHTFSDKELRKIISLEESSRILFWQNKYLNVGEIDNDQKRLETFYRMLAMPRIRGYVVNTASRHRRKHAQGRKSHWLGMEKGLDSSANPELTGPCVVTLMRHLQGLRPPKVADL